MRRRCIVVDVVITSSSDSKKHRSQRLLRRGTDALGPGRRVEVREARRRSREERRRDLALSLSFFFWLSFFSS